VYDLALDRGGSLLSFRHVPDLGTAGSVVELDGRSLFCANVA